VDGAPSTVPKRELIHNRFQVTDRHGRKLDERGRAGVRRAFGLAN
jgi:hypothetical protein